MINKLASLGFIAIVSIWLSGCTTNNGQSINKIASIPVRVKTVESIEDSANTSYVGTIEESVSVPTSFLTTGQAEKVYISEGEKVRKGQLLAELNSSNYLNMYQISLAKQKQAEDAFNRLSELYKKGSLPEIKYIEIQTSLEQAKSSTQIAQKNLNDCKLFSPMDGIVGKRSIEPGMSIIPGITAFNIVKIDKVFVKVAIPENEISKVNKGQKAIVSVSALDNEMFEGIIEEKGVMANPLSHTYDVKIAVSNKNEKLYPGMVCNVQIGLPSTSGVIQIPQQSVQIDGNGKKFVFKINPKTEKVNVQFVETGSLKGDGVIILKGLALGDRIIVEGYQNINVNTTIQIVE